MSDAHLQQSMRVQAMLAHDRMGDGGGEGGSGGSLDQLLLGQGIFDFLLGPIMSNGGVFSAITAAIEQRYGRLSPKSPATGASFSGMTTSQGLSFSWQSKSGGKGISI